ncbi:MAG: UvrD-helicase domain-containing protein [Vicinamibacteria bacterium]|nr:UvrD-helicase domain-containing protein [Vicinamibacteria bacterium]
MSRPPSDQDVRDRILNDFDTTFLLEAGAGTGKTTVLVGRILALVRAGRAPIDRIVAITFTEKAAAELKTRLREGLDEAVASAHDERERTRLAAAAADLERAPISTIHAFASALLRERPFEAGLDPQFQVAAEIAGERLREDVWERWLEARMTAGDPTFVRTLAFDVGLEGVRAAAWRMVAERDIAARPEPRAPFAIESLRERIAQALQVLRPLKSRCLDTADKAYESLERLEAFHERAARSEGVGLELWLRGLQVIGHLGQQGNWKPKETCGQVKVELKAVKEAHETWRAASDADLAWALRESLRGFLATFDQARHEHAVADFTDLLLLTRDVLAQSLPVRRYFQRRFDYVLIDEFQDTDPLQAQIAFFLAEDPEAPPASDWSQVRLAPGKLFVVGDPKQSIYRFRRADIAVYEQARRRIEACGGLRLALDANFRTVPSIVAFVNEQFTDILSNEGDPEPRPLMPFRDEVARDGARTIALPVSLEGIEGKPRVGDVLPRLAATIAGFVDEITRVRPWSLRDRANGVRPAQPGDIGLLVRRMTPEFIGPFEEAFAERGIPYRLVGGKEYFARDEVQALTSVLRAIDNPADRLAVFAALRSPFFALSDDDLFRYVGSGGVLNPLAPVPDGAGRAERVGPAMGLLQALYRQRRMVAPSELIAMLFERSRALPAFRLRHGGAQAVANLWKVLDLARAYEASGPATLRSVVRFLETQREGGSEEGDSPVGQEAGRQLEVVTVHKAKGLEYPIVIAADLTYKQSHRVDAVVRHATGEAWFKVGSLKPAGWEEARAAELEQEAAQERRLLYVALTRARDHLVLPCYAGHREDGWLDQALAGFVVEGKQPPWGGRSAAWRNDGTPGQAEITWFDSRALAPATGVEGAAPRLASIEGSEVEAWAGLIAEEAWTRERRERRRKARQPRRPALAATAAGAPPTSAEDVRPATTEVVDERSVELLDAHVPKAPARTGGEFGRLTHALLLLPRDADLAAMARALAPEYGFAAGDEGVLAAATLAARAHDLPEIVEAGAADRVFREVPFAVPLDGQLVTGRIDLAWRRDGAWKVVDFKTAAFSDETRAREVHGPQLRIYARALAALTGEPVSASLCLLASGRLVPIAP